MRQPSLSAWVVFAVLATGGGMLYAALSKAVLPEGGPSLQELRPGTDRSFVLPQGGVSRFNVDLVRGQCLAAAVEQRGVDLVVELYGPPGEKLLTLDSPTGDRGRERLWHVAEQAGTFRLELRAFHRDRRGAFGLAVEPLRAATSEDRLRAAAAADFAAADGLRRDPARRREALRLFKRALARWERVGDRPGRAMTLRRLGQLSLALGEARESLRWLGEARVAWHALDDRRGEVDLLLETGEAHRSLGEASAAEERFREATALARAGRDRYGEAVALNNRGLLAQSRSDARAAVVHYGRALDVWREVGNRGQEAMTLHNLGTLLSLLARHEEALATLHRALALRRALDDPGGQAATWTEIGWVHYLTGQPRRALECYRRALPLRRAASDLRGEAATLDRQGSALRAVGDLDAALAAYGRSLDLGERLGDPVFRAHTLVNVGEIRLSHGDPEAALRLAREAYVALHDAGDRHGAAHAEVVAARAERALGRLADAAESYARALDTVEALRSEIRDTPFPLEFFSSRHAYYEEYVDLLMEQGDGARAFEAAERSRARGLVDSVGERRGAAAGEPLDLAGIEREVLDDGTLLLEYALGRERSFLWVVGQGSLAAFTLPAEATIDAVARRAAGLAAKSHLRGTRKQAELALAELSEVILAPALPLLDREKRLLVVADGALQSIPFAALPVTGESGDAEPLLARHAVVYLPSASVLAQIRRTRRTSPTRTLAVVGDPVSTTGKALLPFARREAEAVLRLAPLGATLSALGVAATREAVLSGGLRDARIVHFATHGVLDADRPDRSGLAVSEGLVTAGEIGALDLPAELVVLSACRTALGKPLRGEGVLGLARAFFHAGSERVVVSLWDVSDEATAELMRRFYRGLFVLRLPPAEALRRAQLELSREPRHEAPYYWAGFVLQGEIR